MIDTHAPEKPDQADIANLARDLEEKQGIDRIPILLQLSKEYRSYTGISLEYANEARDLAVQFECNPSLARALMQIIEIRIMQGMEAEAITGMDRLRQLPGDDFDDRLQADILSLSSRLHYLKSSFTQAIHDYYAAIERYQKAGYVTEQIEHMKNIGILACNKGDVGSSMVVFQRCLELCRESEDMRCTCQILNNLGIIYQKIGKYEKAVEYHKEAVSIAGQLGDGQLIAAANGNLGIDYHQMQQYKISMRYYELSLKESSRGNQPDKIALMNGNIGRLLHETKQYEQSMEFLNKSLSIYKAIQNHGGEILISIAIAELYLDRGYGGYNPKLSAQLLMNILHNHEDNIEMPRLTEIYKLLSRAYEKTGNPEEAYRNLKAYHQMHEQLESLAREQEDHRFLDLIEEAEDHIHHKLESTEQSTSNEDILLTSEHYGYLTVEIETYNIVKSNPYLYMILGYRSIEDMESRFRILELLQCSDRNLILELETGEHLEEEEIYWDDTRRFLSVNAIYNRESGNAFFLIRDISDQHDIKNRFHHTQSLIRSIINTLPINIFWKKLDGKILGFNQAFKKLANLPYDLDENTTIETIWPFREFEHYRALEYILKEEGTPIVKQPVLETLDSGEQRWLEYTLLKISDGSTVDDILVMLEDVTEIRRLMQSIRENEVKYRTLFESSTDAIMMLDRKGFFDCNQQTIDMFNTKDREHFVGLHPAELSPPTQPSGENSYILAMHHIEEAFNRGFNKFEWMHMRQGGEVFPAEVWLTRFKLQDREVLQASVRDITQAKLIAQALHEARRKADQANKAKSEFLANMSHEIRTPLHAVLGFADLLYSSIEDATLKEYVSTIQAGGKSLLNIIDEVLDLSKIEAGLLKLEYHPLSITDLLKEIVTLSAIRAQKKNIQISTRIDPDIPEFILLDTTRLRQILLNLVSNAVKFTPRGSITIYADLINLREECFDLHLAVQDTGIGIREEACVKIFDAFYQEPSCSMSAPKGTGLGLTITKRFVELMNGNIRVTSIPGEGSRFDVVFRDVQICRNIPRYLDTQNDTEEITFEPATILIADESEDNRRIIRDTLVRQPIVLIEAVETKQALAIANEKRPELILYSSDLPGIDARSFMVELRNGGRMTEIPVVVMTAAMPGISSTDFLQMGFDGYLAKPFTLQEFIRQLARFLPHDRPSAPVGG